MTTLEARTPEWLKWRRGGIGASDIATIAGLNPWKGPWGLWLEKVGEAPEVDESEEMEFGRRAEAMLGDYFLDRTGLYIAGEQTWCSHPEHEHHLSTVDGFAVEGPNSAIADALGVVEKKTTFVDPFTDGEVHEVWDMYQCQAQWQMHVTGMPKAWLAVLHGRKFRVYEVDRDEDDIAALVQVAERFWGHVLDHTMPEPDQRDLNLVKSRFPTARSGSEIELDGEHREVLEAYRLAKATVKVAEEQADALQARLLAFIGDAETVVAEGVPVATWKTQARKSYNHTALEADFPEAAQAVRYENQYRVLRLKKEKAA